ncbi:hypothetical protein QO010_001866 [Caulobacter ginsengisoli]|uniref:Uncharacterized protein n=1 Tax=Caulobacter ginsengisoli TaxID=400775 RepID=A0ABU0IQ11_9CAUL|nr:hypothetical protein [Caulobacter ginsengisoli]MDQ0464095.1 hypothetical protein [Caulobacter ginsengisoli]
MEDGDERQDLTGWLSPGRGDSGSAQSALRRMAGYLLMTIGALWALACGACTVNATLGAMGSVANPGALAAFGLIIILPGLGFTGVGLVVLRWGWRVAHGGPKIEPETFE